MAHFVAVVQGMSAEDLTSWQTAALRFLGSDFPMTVFEFWMPKNDSAKGEKASFQVVLFQLLRLTPTYT